MIYRRKPWLGIAAAALVATLLAAVAGSATASTTGATASRSAKKGKVVELSFWYGLGGNLGKTVEKFVSSFNSRHPGIHVNATYQGSYSGGGPEQQKILAAIAAGNAPDLAQLEVNSMPAFKGALRPITKLMMSTKDMNPSVFLPGILASTKFGKDYYGVPWNRSAPVIIYNATMLKAHGISAPPSTWQELQKDAATLTSNGVVGFEPVAQWWFEEAAVETGGARLLSPNLKQATFNTVQALVAPELRQQMIKAGIAKPHNSNDPFGDTIADFGNGRTAMADMTNSSLAAINAAVAGKFEWGVAPYPKVPGTNYALPPGGANIAMFKSMPDSKVQAAWTFMRWLDSTAQTANWSMDTGYAPVKEAAVNLPLYKHFLSIHPQFAVPLKEIPYTISPPPTPQIYGILEYIQQAQTDAWFTGKSIADTFNTAASETDQLLSQG